MVIGDVSGESYPPPGGDKRGGISQQNKARIHTTKMRTRDEESDAKRKRWKGAVRREDDSMNEASDKGCDENKDVEKENHFRVRCCMYSGQSDWSEMGNGNNFTIRQ